MASQVFSGVGPINSTTKFTYTNNTGQNVRVRIMNLDNASSIFITGSGVVLPPGYTFVNLSSPTTTPRDYVLAPGQILTISGGVINAVQYNIVVIPEGG